MKHTETPWQAIVDGDLVYIDNDAGNNICDLYHITAGGFTHTKQNAEANAAFIVKAVNNHYSLKEALELMLERYVDLVNCGDCGSWNPEEEVRVIKAREAIKQAEAENERNN